MVEEKVTIRRVFSKYCSSKLRLCQEALGVYPHANLFGALQSHKGLNARTTKQPVLCRDGHRQGCFERIQTLVDLKALLFALLDVATPMTPSPVGKQPRANTLK